MARPIRSVLIANRGEIAVRVIRACRELGIETVQAYSEADRDSLPVKLADRSVCIGGPRSAESYLNAAFLISAASTRKADAIHPGYGFLSENADFAELCGLHDIIFIGPRPEVISLMGNKAAARKLAEQVGVPTTPGSAGTVATLDEAAYEAERVGYPVILKASAGGGGRGMRIVWEPGDLCEAFQQAQKESSAAFADGSLYVERYLTEIRHVEVQVLADNATVLHLGERDCSIQKRHQKLLEESPSPALTRELRHKIGEAAVRLARHAGYTNAGTVEFVLNEKTGEFFFMEMNTRIQVEHPVTEMVTGVDLVKSQIQIASGEPLQVSQDQISLEGHAIECRVNAEDFACNFMPCPGTVTRYLCPGGPGIRVDSHLFPGYQIPPYYDSLLAKLIAWGRTRDEAISRMQRALRELVIDGVRTTAPFHAMLLDDTRFQRGEVSTRFVQDLLAA